MPPAAMTEPTMRFASGAAALLLLGACLQLAGGLSSPLTPFLIGFLATAALALAQSGLTGRLPTVKEFLIDAAAVAIIAAARDPAVAVWQIPAHWSDLLRLSTPGAAVAASVYGISALIMPLREDRHLALHESISLLCIPVLFNSLLLLAANPLLQQLGAAASLSMLQGEAATLLGRTLVLFAFTELLFAGLSFFITGRLSRDRRLHLLVVLCCAHAVLSARIAELPQAFGHAGWPVQAIVAACAAALAQAGLWAFVYVGTGVVIQAVAGRPPTFAAARSHWKNGFVKGAIFGAVFAALAVFWGGVLALAALLPGRALALGPVAAFAILAGALAFPFIATVVGSADETPPFFRRLKAAYKTPRTYFRGAVCGLGIFVAISLNLPGAAPLSRFGMAFLIGALAYGGVDFASDAVRIALHYRRERQCKFAPWQVYALGLLLGGLVGGALGWYFDTAQIDVVAAKLRAYADLSYATSGRPANDYVIYPLFSKWGVIDLGNVKGGIALFFTESLSGVINWSLAAPLFGINFILLAALLERSLRPLRELFSQSGLDGLVVQTVRVLRWGLWMAPVIFTFLKMSPEPSWYNQDGAIRTIAAVYNSIFMPGHEFRAWSLVVFTGLLAYDWLRILIWFDHMGLRVATLVNLTFLGGDKADEAAARLAGYAAPARFIPEGIRRFATWMPLLIPFYIPRGADWDRAWSGAEKLRNLPMPQEITGLTGAYALAALWTAALALLVSQHWTRLRSSPGALMPGVPHVLTKGRPLFNLSNGAIGLQLRPDGCGYRHIYETARGGAPIDLTPRLTDPLQVRGLFFYVYDRDSGEVFSLGYEPCHVAAPDYSIDEIRPGTLKLVNHAFGIRAEAEIRLDETASVELWHIRLVNLGTVPRRLAVTSFQELSVAEFPAYARDRDFHALHVATWFVAPLDAIFARNRLLRAGGPGQADLRMSREIFFHAVRTLGSDARVLGYEDSRTRFLGMGDIRRPAGLDPARARPCADQGLLYTFDPAASLSVGIDLLAGASSDVLFINGHARDEREAAALASAYVGCPLPDEAVLAAAMRQVRALKIPPPRQGWPFAFSPKGDVLSLTQETPRPWAHVLANPLGYGAIVSNDGEIHSFAGNERQNALTPHNFGPVASGLPGQIVYVVDIDRGDIACATYVPLRREDTRHEVHYEKGVARFCSFGPDLDLELTLFVPHDCPADVRLLKIRNKAEAKRRFRVVPYFDLALAESTMESAGRIETARDTKANILFFSNPANTFYKGWGFAATSFEIVQRETIRARFVGALGRDLTRPVMAATNAPDPHVGDDGHRIAACTGLLEVEAGHEVEVSIVFGEAANRAQATDIVQKLRGPSQARAALAATRDYWATHGPVIEIESNNPQFDRLVNHWLHYEAVACRLYARGGPNQRSGAYGFRDQLQDVLPLLFSDPGFVRKQILLHASQQFAEGDVLKWWHPTRAGRTGLGQRSRASDPHLWLPYVTTRYLAATGDSAILSERTPYLIGPSVPRDTDSLTFVPRASREDGNLYEHCRLALDYSLAHFGAHGLPLVGTGDWNDGIDLAGFKGRGESVWLGFFLYGLLQDFAPLIVARESKAQAERYYARAISLKAALDETWNGDHYIIGYTDSGAVLDRYGSMTAAWPILTSIWLDDSGLAHPYRGGRCRARPGRTRRKSRLSRKA
jgi:cyclic beta-1,2-glucan synthetase